MAEELAAPEQVIASPLFEVAAEHATDSVPIARRDQRVADVRDQIAGREFDAVDDVAVLDGERLVGIVPLRLLIAAAGDALIADVMDVDPPRVAPGADQEEAAWKMVRHGESSLAVVNGDGSFLGLIPPRQMLEVLLAEHDEDLARIGGYLASSEGARSAAEEPVPARLWHRFPSLAVGLVGAMASAVLIGAFEHELDRKVVLALFVPAVVYMSAAVGNQTQTVLIRGLAVGVTLRSAFRQEVLTGVILGVIFGVAFLPFALIGWGDGAVAVAVALAVFASCSVASLVAMALPWLLIRMGSDPAFGAGPLATVVQDLLAIAIYLAIAIPLAA